MSVIVAPIGIELTTNILLVLSSLICKSFDKSSSWIVPFKIFSVVTESVANLFAVTEPSFILVSVIAPSAILEVVNAPSLMSVAVN